MSHPSIPQPVPLVLSRTTIDRMAGRVEDDIKALADEVDAKVAPLQQQIDALRAQQTRTVFEMRAAVEQLGAFAEPEPTLSAFLPPDRRHYPPTLEPGQEAALERINEAHDEQDRAEGVTHPSYQRPYVQQGQVQQ
ncbi:hypothetical protein [Herbidospora daliensis]|uniref:hypothetical protein n=1 Tax=Herbidospora daliensis TaxID=295585 RepID=UPI0007816D54|nr:hypothetical protein [Herbidospora daliensis]